MPDPELRRPRLDDEDGLSLVELLVAVLMLSVAIMALASVATSGLASVRTSRARQQAIDAASSVIEEARSQDYGELAVVPSTVTAGAGLTGANPRSFDPDEGGPLPSEEFIESSFGAIDFERMIGENNRLRVRTYVTWADTARTAKRVTSIVTWLPDPTNEIQEMTIVAPADRGLPAPEFVVGDPTEAYKRISPSAVNGGGCFSHILRNLGAADSYDWNLGLNSPVTTPAATVTFDGVSTYRVAGWQAQGYLQITDVDTTAAKNPPLASDLMTNADGTARPERGSQVATQGEGYFTVCYAPSGIGAPELHPIFQTTLYSRFDDRVTDTVTQEIEIKVPQFRLYLSSETKNDRTSPMNETVPATGTLKDLDDNSTDRNVPGMSIGKGKPAEQLTWSWQYLGAETVQLNAATINYWVSWNDALKSSGCSTNLRTITPSFTLERLNASGTVTATATNTHTITHAQCGWQHVSQVMTLGTMFTSPFKSFEQLRLKINCPAGSQVDCHFAYGVTQGTGTPQPYQTNLYVSGS